MKLTKRFNFLFVSVALIATCQTISGQDISSVGKLLPEQANTLSAVDFDALRQSSWTADNGLDIGDFIGIPDDANRVIIATELDYQTFTPRSQIAFATYDQQLSLNSLARHNNTQVDSLAGKNVVWFSDGDGGQNAVMSVDNRSYAIVPSDSRQSAARWIRSVANDSGKSRASEFLVYALDQFSPEHPVVIAMDFRDALTPNAFRRPVDNSQMFKTAEAANVAAVLNSIEGLVVTIQAKDQLAGEIQIRFGNDAGPLQGHSATLAHFMLRDMGAKVDDIAEWGETIDGNMLTLAGTLKLSTLSDIVTMTLHDARMPRRLRTLSRGLRDIEIARASDAELTGQANISDGGKRISDSDESDTEQAQSSNESNMEDVRSSATQEYLKRLENLLQAAHRKSDESLSQSRFWLDRYSFKIQYLDRESVDHDLLTFADETTNRMRLMADTIEDAMQEAAEGSGTDWQPTPTWRTVNYGGVLVRRRAWFNSESGWGRGMSDEDRLEVQAEIQNALTKAKDFGITTVRDFNKMGAMLANKYGFDFEEWSPGQLR